MHNVHEYLVCVIVLQLSSVADDDSGSFVQVMETFQNIGPILDMSVVDLDKQGQDLVSECVCVCVCVCTKCMCMCVCAKYIYVCGRTVCTLQYALVA